MWWHEPTDQGRHGHPIDACGRRSARCRHEARGRAELADQWFAMLDAPRRQLTVADTSGHRPRLEQPEQFHVFMINTVLARTQQTG